MLGAAQLRGDDLMAMVKPFRAVRFNTEIAGDISRLVCPPYDIISDKERDLYIEQNENNIVRLELPKGSNAYVGAKRLYDEMKQKGILKRDTEDSIYIYEQEFQARGAVHKVKGFICLVKLEEFEKGVVLPHEYTLSKAKEDRFELMKATNCNFSQVYSLYMDDEHVTTGKLDFLSVREPDLSFKSFDGVINRLWRVTDPAQIKSICADFDDRKLYIADGHHRYETALNYRNYCRENGTSKPGDPQDYIMMMLVDIEHPGLVVLPTHRLVHSLNVFNPELVLSGCEKYFEIERHEDINTIEDALAAEYQNGATAFVMYCGGNEYYLLRFKDRSIMEHLEPDLSEPARKLDVTVLHSVILERIFGITKENMANQTNLSYTKKIEEAISSVSKGESCCAFIMNPTRVTEIRDVAAAGDKMPQKSTYFYPKLITGLVLNELAD